jgi:hypothetical protein
MPVDDLPSFRSAYTLVAISWPFFFLIEMKGLTSYRKSPSQLTGCIISYCGWKIFVRVRRMQLAASPGPSKAADCMKNYLTTCMPRRLASCREYR